MADLFSGAFESKVDISLPHSTIYIYIHALVENEANNYFLDLQKSIPWKEEEIVVWGKRHKQPRLIAWFGDPRAVYSYSGSKLTPHPWTPALDYLRGIAETLSGETFNSVLLNLYRNQFDQMGWHSDDEPELGEEPTIASLSLGATRTFQMKNKKEKNTPIKSFELTSGSLLVMAGETQRHWQHAIKKESKVVGPRINLTFRRIAARH